jgi:ribosomal protein S18 acetylase RimI-like enzyme
MEVQILKQFNKQDFESISALYSEFGADKKTDLSSFKFLLEGPSEIIVLRDGEKIIGMGTLNYLPRLSRLDGEVNDVVVSEKYRGKGLGTVLMTGIIARAREKKVVKLHLTSRPARVAANELYKKLGFEQRETNVYQMKL